MPHQVGIRSFQPLDMHDHHNVQSGGQLQCAIALSDHDKAEHDPLLIDADTVDGEEAVDIVSQARVEAFITKLFIDALAINADQVDGEEANAIVTNVRVKAHFPDTIANLLSNHSKAVHDALALDAGKLTFDTGCRAFLDNPQLIPRGVDTKILFDAEDYDIGANFDTANSKFVAPSDGYYFILASAKILVLTVGKRLELKIKIDALAWNAVSLMGGGHASPTALVYDIIPLTTGQEITIHVKHTDTIADKNLADEDELTFVIIRKVGV